MSSGGTVYTMEEQEQSQQALAPLIRVVENAADDLLAVQERLGERPPEMLDRLTRYELTTISRRLGDVAMGVHDLAYTPLPAREIPPPPEDAELYKRLLDPKFLSRPAFPDYSMPPIIIVVLDDMAVGVRGRRVHLT